MSEQELPSTIEAAKEPLSQVEFRAPEVPNIFTDLTTKLNPEQQFAITEPSVAAILEEYGIAEFTFAEVKSGVENVTLLIESASNDRFALRVYRQDKKSTSEILEEVEFSNFLGSHGVPVPAVLATEDGRTMSEVTVDGKSWQSLLMEFKGGAHAEAYSYYLIKQMAALQAKMHLLGSEFAIGRTAVNIGPSKLSPDALLLELDPDVSPDARLEGFIRRAQAFEVELGSELPRGFSHFDYDRGNLLVADDNISAVLDFDDTKYAPLVMCLANTLWNVMETTRDEADLHLYTTEYQHSRPLSALERASIKDIMLFRHYLVSGMRAKFGKTDEASISGFLDLEKKIQNLHKFSGSTYEPD